jgi:hypothetical protein
MKRFISGYFFFLSWYISVRRATIAISFLGMLGGLLTLLSLIGAEAVKYNFSDEIGDDELIDIIEKSFIKQAIFSSIGLLTSLCCFVGAIQYNPSLVIIHAVWLVVDWIANVAIEVKTFKEVEDNYSGTEDLRLPVGGYVSMAFVVILFIYPLVRFVGEVKSGIMSRETYPREDFSCCCNKNSY